MRRLVMVMAVIALVAAACSSDAAVASRNLSVAADQFEIDRSIVFFNGITDTYLLQINGKCSIEADELDRQLLVTIIEGLIVLIVLFVFLFVVVLVRLDEIQNLLEAL